MDKPVAPYLIAIAAGDLAFRELGPRTGVWTEPVMLDKAAAELADTEKMVEAAETLYGPYRWGRYDMIVLPPSFPYGGMENPTLTFLTPTFIAGDKSLVGLVAHELAHSWSGNLVTNATWADCWLNEGFTTYFENRIMEALYGPKRARSRKRAQLRRRWRSRSRRRGMDAPVTRLHLAPAEANPDGGATDIVYDKGATFLRTIELIGRARTVRRLASLLVRPLRLPADDLGASSSPISAQNLVKGDAALEKQADARPMGLPARPAGQCRPAGSRGLRRGRQGGCRLLGRRRPHRMASAAGPPTKSFASSTSLPRKLPGRPAWPSSTAGFGLNEAGNNEVLFAWLELAVANRYDPAVPALEKFLTVQGRRKFVRPLITALAEDSQWGRPIAARIYAKARPSYHPVTTRDLDKLGCFGQGEIRQSLTAK